MENSRNHNPIIQIPATLISTIEAAAIACAPQECCGMLGGWRDASGDITVTEIAESTNVSIGNKRKTFEVDPQVRFNLMRSLEVNHARGHALEIVGHYHSHPDHPALPSETDLKAAHEPDFIWIIASVKNGQVDEITAHQLINESKNLQFQQIELRILQD